MSTRIRDSKGFKGIQAEYSHNQEVDTPEADETEDINAIRAQKAPIEHNISVFSIDSNLDHGCWRRGVTEYIL